MGNMAYCRFENTAGDLADCQEHLFDDDLSDGEKAARKRLVRLCQQIASDAEEVLELD